MVQWGVSSLSLEELRKDASTSTAFAKALHEQADGFKIKAADDGMMHLEAMRTRIMAMVFQDIANITYKSIRRAEQALQNKVASTRWAEQESSSESEPERPATDWADELVVEMLLCQSDENVKTEM